MKTILKLIVMVAGCGLLWVGSDAAESTPDSQPAVVKVDYKPYPFDTSVVSGAKLGAQPVVFVQDGYEVKVASASEEEAYKKNPAPFLAKIKQAYATAKPYPLDTCLVCDMKLEDDAITFVYLGQQYKVCGGDEDCFAVFQKDPATYVKKFAEAKKPSPAAAP